MKFDDLDKQMRVYEQSMDQFVIPENYIIVRLDGRGFTRLTKELCNFEAPFDVRFRDLMVGTVKALMSDTGMKIVYGYTESDEISLLFSKDADAFSRKVRKLNSILAGAASAEFSLALGRAGVFDARVIPIPNRDVLVDYFRWRMEDAHRNSLNSWCYWTLRKEGMSPNAASKELSGKSNAYKNELLFQRGINYNDLPSWQKRGVGVYWNEVQKEGYNPVKETTEIAIRRELIVDYELDLKEEPIRISQLP